MDPSIEKSSSSGDEKQDYWDSLEDEQKMSWQDLKTAFQSEPYVAAHFGIGDKNYKLQPWKICKGSMSPRGAAIKLMHGHYDRSYLPGYKLDKSGYKDVKKYFVKRKDLEDFQTAGWTPAIQAQGGGAPPA